MKTKTKNIHFGGFLRYLALIGGAIIMVVPFLWMISTSLKEYAYVIEFPPRLIPKEPTLNNFVEAWTTGQFQLYLTNSLIVAIFSVVLAVLLSAMMAYAFARFEFPGKEVLFFGILLLLMVPNIIGIIPQFLLAIKLGLRNSLFGLILFYVATSLPLNTFLLRGFFETLPKELEDAMLIDGANYFTIFVRLVLPLSTPALATVSIFSLLGFWDEYIMALTFIDEQAKRTLPIAIGSFHGQHGTDWGLVFAASLIAMVPIVTVYVVLQRYFTGGLTTGAFKG